MSKFEYLRFIESDNSFVIKNVVLSYPHLFEKWTNTPAKPETARYGATFILDKETHAAEIAELQSVLKPRQKAKWKASIPADRLALRDGDATGKEEYAGKMILVTSDKKIPPNCLDRNGKRQLKESDDKLYAGAIVNGRFNFWDQDNAEGGKRINASLIGVQFMDDGERFSNVSRPAADETFDDEGGGEASDGFDD